MVLLEHPGLPPEEARPDSPPEGKEAEEEPKCEVLHVSGKGKGLFARSDLGAGQLVLRESPLLLMPNEVYSADDMDRIERWLDRRLNALSCERRAAFFDLSDCRSPSDDKTVLGIFFTNDMDFGGDAALFPDMARANHSCAPNADFVSRLGRGVQDLVATRDIKAGEEITISYLPAAKEGSDVREVRQDYMRQWYGFRCCCKACNMEVSRAGLPTPCTEGA